MSFFVARELDFHAKEREMDWSFQRHGSMVLVCLHIGQISINFTAAAIINSP
jgi:hypothetical protein